MKLLIVMRVPARAGGHPSQSKRTVVADWVRVGRNASCELHLPDPRIALEQGLIIERNGLVYLEGEGALVTKNTTRRAVRSVRLDPGEPLDIGPYRLEVSPAPEGYDGVAELWWDSREDLKAGGATPEGRAAGTRLLDDERAFIDLARSPLWLAEEHAIID